MPAVFNQDYVPLTQEKFPGPDIFDGDSIHGPYYEDRPSHTLDKSVSDDDDDD